MKDKDVSEILLKLCNKSRKIDSCTSNLFPNLEITVKIIAVFTLFSMDILVITKM